MDLNTIIKQLRIENKISQKDLYSEFFSKSVYQKIEAGERELMLSELKLISEKLGVNEIELILLTQNNSQKEIDILRNELKTFLQKKSSIRIDNKLREINDTLCKNKFKNIEWFNLYLFFTIGFFQKKEFVLPPHKQDLQYLKKYYDSKTFFTAVDYKVYLDLICKFEMNEVKFLEDKLFPVTHKMFRSETFISYVFLAYNNMITYCIAEHNFEKGFQYLKQALEFENKEIEYYSKIQFLYLEQLLNYEKYKHEKNVIKELSSFIEAIKFSDLVAAVGDKRQAETMKNELQQMKANDNLRIPSEFGFMLLKPASQIQEFSTVFDK